MPGSVLCLKPCVPAQALPLQADNPDGSSYLWDFGDGWTVTTPGPSVNYMYNDTGCFDVTLTISNDGCMADSTIADAICIWGAGRRFHHRTGLRHSLRSVVHQPIPIRR
jgi:hypothetical protein